MRVNPFKAAWLFIIRRQAKRIKNQRKALRQMNRHLARMRLGLSGLADHHGETRSLALRAFQERNEARLALAEIYKACQMYSNQLPEMRRKVMSIARKFAKAHGLSPEMEEAK